ncbi:hypothetical protein Hgul01_01689 [Herpetosiphon gulosus]|uniref:Uncharacterized protein n=2 Tax=Herpetosiphon gulosus TaxID=1973496 RepID=A0ABP9WXI3_9CHLR
MDYHVPTIEPSGAVRWQRWFWRSWGRLILTAIVANLVGVTMSNLLGWVWLSIWLGDKLPNREFWQIMGIRRYDSYASAGLLMGLFFGFWISAFTTLLLRKKLPKRYQLFWFVLHYMVGAVVVVVIGLSLIQLKFPDITIFQFQHLFELPIASFTVASGLVGWQMQRWLKRPEH